MNAVFCLPLIVVAHGCGPKDPPRRDPTSVNESTTIDASVDAGAPSKDRVTVYGPPAHTKEAVTRIRIARGDVTTAAKGDPITDHACMRFSGGSLACWKRGRAQPLMFVDQADRTVPIDDFDVARGFVCAVSTQGELYCGGDDNGSQELGRGPGTPHPRAQQVQGLSRVERVWLGTHHACASTKAHEVFCWGGCACAECGFPAPVNGGVAPRKLTNLPTRAGDVVEMALGDAHTCALTKSGAVYCWGSNDHDQLGSSATIGTPGATDKRCSQSGYSSRPLEVAGLSKKRIQRISAGPAHTCALAADGTLWCWGSNGASELGTGVAGASGLPREVTGGPWSEVQAGGMILEADADAKPVGTTCAANLAGEFVCWGAHFGYDQTAMRWRHQVSGPAQPDFRPATDKPSTFALGGRFKCAVVGEQVFCDPDGSRHYGGRAIGVFMWYEKLPFWGSQPLEVTR